MTLLIVLAFVFAVVLFALGAKNFGAPAWNLISLGALALTVALLLEFLQTAKIGG